MPTASSLPTLGPVIDSARRTATRFPLVMAAGFLSVVAGILAIDQVGPSELRGRLLVATSLGIPLFIALQLYGERRRHGATTRALVALTGVAALTLVYMSWPGWSEPVRVARYFQMSVAFHLSVSFLPFLCFREQNGFWQYNRLLLERFVTGALYTVVLYGGFAIALAAIGQLFAANIPGEAYGRLWVVAAFLFNTWFFLAGIPNDLSALEDRHDYPPGLKRFTQYVLIPLVVTYLVILMAYLAKVLVTWDWPSGWIGWLVSSVAAVGILALLLVYPVAEEHANRWVATYTRWFYITLLPAIVMLWLAIWQRIEQYGVTERRYFLLVLSFWLAGIAIHYARTRSRNITPIPASLCLVAFLTLAGPWGPYSISERSQTNRLEALLTANQRFANDRAIPSDRAVTFDQAREINAGFRYVLETHGTGGIDAWFGDSLSTIAAVVENTPESRRITAQAKAIGDYLGIEYVSRWQREPNRRIEYVADHTGLVMPLSGYEYAVRLRSQRTVESDTGLVAWTVFNRRVIQIRMRGAVITEVPVDPALEAARAYLSDNSDADGSGLPPTVLRSAIDDERARVIVYFSSLRGADTDSTVVLRSIEGYALVTIK